MLYRLTHLTIGACMPGHTRALPGLFQIMHTHITRTSPYLVYVCYAQCRDKIRFPQLCIKCGVAQSCPGTHTGLQVPMHLTWMYFTLTGLISCVRVIETSKAIVAKKHNKNPVVSITLCLFRSRIKCRILRLATMS